MTTKDIYWNIDHARKRRGMTEKEFCARIGISTKTWKRYEIDPTPLPMGTIEKAAHLMMVPIMELMKGGAI